MVKGEWYPWAEDIMRMGPRLAPSELADTLHYGEYLARTACTECHGNEFEGDGGPDLAIAAVYSPDDFARLMRTGIAMGQRELQLMSSVSRSRFSHFTDAEIRALHAFLRARASKSDGS
jgi:mono/diheme cytochrome c family protein